MSKIKAELKALTTRRDALVAKQITAQAAHDRALDARQRHMLEGNLEDEPVSIKRQAAVDSTASALAGFEFAFAAMASQISEAEGRLAAEQLEVDRKAGSEKVTADTDEFEALRDPWLDLTRKLAAAAAKVGGVHYEAGQIGGYLLNAASEVEMAIDVSIPNLRAFAINIAAGHMPIPQAPPVVVPIVTKSVSPTRQVFTWHAISWTDADGNKRVMPKWSDADLPLDAAAFALKTGLAIEPDDPRCKAQRGLGSRHPEPSWINDLDTKIGPNIPGSQQSTRVDDPAASFIKPRQANAPYVIKHREQAS